MFHKQSLDIRNFEHTSEAGEGMFKPGSASRNLKTVAEFQKCGTEHKGALSLRSVPVAPGGAQRLGGPSISCAKVVPVACLGNRKTPPTVLFGQFGLTRPND